MLLFYIRHGNPIYSPDSLTPLGRRQAEAVARRLALYGIDQIYTSTSTRAIQTAEPTCEILNKEAIQLDWANEHHAYTDFSIEYPESDNSERKTDWVWRIPNYRELLNSTEVRSLGDKWYRHPAFANKNMEAGIHRVQNALYPFLSDLGYVHDEKANGYFAKEPNDLRIALFAHEGFYKVFMSCLLDIPYPLFSTHFDIGHSDMSVILFPNKPGLIIPTVLQSSNDSHLYREGLMTGYNGEIRF